VAAHYLLTLLAEAAPRGLPGATIERVELQRSGEGHPLDDVIIKGSTQAGEPTLLEVQVKRTVTFSPSDVVFKDVVTQLAEAFRTLNVAHLRHQFAVAIDRTSFKITGPYQDVLRWAREVSSSSVFFGRINRKKVGNDDMRTFVETVRSHFASAACLTDDETVWQVLRRFQILTFDYDAPGSQALELAVERARNVLAPSDVTRASALWSVLTETAIRVAATGGDLDRTRLVDEVANAHKFRLLGTKRNRVPQETLAEAARLSAADLRRTIAGVSLARTAQLDAVRGARDQARFIEILGGPGVGKSGLLGVLVDQVLTEGRAVLLTPERTISGGWLAFKAALQLESGPETFLSDLAADGGAVLFIDSIDFFDDLGKRATVIDLVRAAASVPTFQVIVTARTEFDKLEPTWLPADALEKLGRARPVLVEELGPEEIEELSAAAPALRALLADDHPARAVARNLFRLSRLLEVQGSTDQLRSEVDLLERWWSTADGPEAERRERARVIADLAQTILSGGDRLETRLHSSAVDALVASGTVRELGLDRLVFRHDILREWGVAARLNEAPEKIDQLALTAAAPASLARAVELCARFKLERSPNGEVWIQHLKQVSPTGSHVSWRRWSLLAILRSEIASRLLDRACESLLEGDGALLRELIRTSLAVESRPLAEILAEVGVDAKLIPAGIFGPTNPSWAKLTRWLLARRAELPLRVLPDVVELFQSLSASMFFTDPLTPTIAVALADWLEEIEDAQDHSRVAPAAPRFASEFESRELHKLATDVRQALFLMASRAPDRVQGYLRRLLGRRHAENTIREIIRFRGTLAQAAPAELVELTLTGLIPKKDKRSRRATENKTFTYLDSDFLPSSPAQGPFLDLLNAAPEHGLNLIRRLVNHAVTTEAKQQMPDEGDLLLAFPAGPRSFPSRQSYTWSRQHASHYAVESGLLALEAWSHARMERGDAQERVLADILGPEGSPAAFLLVAVDVLISHWPKTIALAVPFVGSPELLSLDRSRQIHDMLPGMDWGAIGSKEPKGQIRLADLKKRPSRRLALESLLGSFAFDKSADRNGLHALLTGAAERLGSPEPDDTFADPRFMVHYALNLIDPANWHQFENRPAYVSPPEERRHLEALQNARAAQTADFEIDAAIQNALEDSSRSSPELAERAVAYAKRLLEASSTPEDILRSRTNAIVSAAMILARDGTDLLLDTHEEWARGVFAKALAATEETRSLRSDSIRFNPVATATLGLIRVWRRRGRDADRELLLALAGRDSPDAAQGFGADLPGIRETDPRLVPALLRCALVAQTQPTHEWGDPEDVKGARQAQHRQRVTGAIEAEVAWLADGGPEPAWPTLPPRTVSIRRRLRVGGHEHDVEDDEVTSPSEQLRSQSGALWVRQLTRDFTESDLDWMVDFVDAYGDWTAAANGAGLESGAEIENRTSEWNSVYFSLLARTFARMTPEHAISHVARAAAIPDESFFDIASELVSAIDGAYFNGWRLEIGTALRLRSLLTDRLVQSDGWRHETQKAELSVEMRIGPAIAGLFFNQYSSFMGASCYLTPKGIDQVEPFFPELVRLIEEGPVPFTGMLTMNLLEVSPRKAHLQFLLTSALTWHRRQPKNTRLWVEFGLGARLAKWLEEVVGVDVELRSASHPLRPEIDDLLARLVQSGVAEAHRVEKQLSIEAG
jgi:hypothetical protein